MQNNFIDNTTTSARILITFLLISILFISHSIELTLSITIFVLITIIMSNKSVNLYINSIKKSIIWLIFCFIVYIIIYNNIIGSIIFIYKMIMSIIIIKNFMLNVNFNSLNNGIYTLLFPLKRILPNLEHICFNITMYIYYIVELRSSSNLIQKSQIIKNKKDYSVKYFILPRLFAAVNNIEELEQHLMLNFYTVKRENFNLKSIIALIIFILLFLIAVFKEVIL